MRSLLAWLGDMLGAVGQRWMRATDAGQRPVRCGVCRGLLDDEAHLSGFHASRWS